MTATQQRQFLNTDPSVLPWASIRQELKGLAPAHAVMIDFMLSDLEDRASMLSERDQVREFLIVILSTLSPGFPKSREEGPRVN